MKRLYEKYAFKQKFKIEERLSTGRIGFELSITGIDAYNILKKETGLHRFTRVSPFGNGKIHTSLIKVLVSNKVEASALEILNKDLIYEPFKSTGAGGQHRNKTESAIRLTHIPTGVVCLAVNSRCQHENKREALNLLKEKLSNMQRDNILRDKKLGRDLALKDDLIIRSYYFNHNLVVDEISGKKSKNIKGILNGELDI